MFLFDREGVFPGPKFTTRRPGNEKHTALLQQFKSRKRQPLKKRRFCGFIPVLYAFG